MELVIARDDLVQRAGVRVFLESDGVMKQFEEAVAPTNQVVPGARH
jgi:hypothetical protein